MIKLYLGKPLKKYLLFLMAATIILMAQQARAQQTKTITGTVTDEAGLALPGVTVTCERPVLNIIETLNLERGCELTFPFI
ncbi:carboxypeptidase-like regulatory domain-containing protein [Pedobacter sp. GSP4]|uniref:carboxypeptidase-like regulatory domain-containing protein n=1 Tax=Pedobacter sp. GSP4 TaxID=3453716 RepID=UPI003EEC4395